MIYVEYLGLCGYIVETNNAVYVFDYVEGRLPSAYLVQDKPVYFLISSEDARHFSSSVFSYQKTVVMPRSANFAPFRNVFAVNAGDVIHLGFGTIRVFENGYQGVSYLIEDDKRSFFHGGCLSGWHYEDRSNEVKLLENREQFVAIVERIREFSAIDMAIFMVDPRKGKNCDEEIRYVIETLKPRFVFPMNYDNDFQNMQQFRQWTELLPQTEVHFPKYVNHTFPIEI